MTPNSMILTLVIHGIPKAQPRPRACKRGNRAGVYDPGTANAWKQCVMAAAVARRPPRPIAGPVKLTVRYYFPRPKSHYGTGRNAGVLKATAPDRHTQTPDLENVNKATLDALTDAGVWIDDSQVVTIRSSKHWGERGMAQVQIVDVTEQAKRGAA